MPPPKRNLLATAELTSTPPSSLPPNHTLARVISASGKNLYNVSTPSGETLMVELPARFRSTIWIKRRGYVLVDTAAFENRENKLGGEIVNVVREERKWRKMDYWPKEFAKEDYYGEDSEEESNVGKMPPEEEDVDVEA